MVLLAPSLAFLMLLAAAGAVSAADGLDLGDTADGLPVVPAVDPVAVVETVAAKVEPAKEQAVRTVKAVSAAPAETAVTVVSGARDKVEGVVRPIIRPVAPIPVPPVIVPPVPPVTLPDLPVIRDLPDVVERPRVVQPRRPDARDAAPAPTQALPVGLASAITSALNSGRAPSSVASVAEVIDGNLVLRPMQPVLPVGPTGATGDAAIGGSGAGSGPWLGQGPVSLVGFPWRSVDRPAVPLSVPRGVTPQFVVPPG